MLRSARIALRLRLLRPRGQISTITACSAHLPTSLRRWGPDVRILSRSHRLLLWVAVPPASFTLSTKQQFKNDIESPRIGSRQNPSHYPWTMIRFFLDLSIMTFSCKKRYEPLRYPLRTCTLLLCWSTSTGSPYDVRLASSQLFQKKNISMKLRRACAASQWGYISLHLRSFGFRFQHTPRSTFTCRSTDQHSAACNPRHPRSTAENKKIEEVEEVEKVEPVTEETECFPSSTSEVDAAKSNM